MRFPQNPLRLLPLLLAAALPGLSDEMPVVQGDFGYTSSYVFRGIERAGDSAQATVELNRNAFRAGLWANQPLRAGDPDEFNLNAAYAWEATGELTLEASAAYTWFGGVPGGGVERSFEVGLVAKCAPIQGFMPSLGYHHDFYFQADTAEASLARSIALPRFGAFLELNFFAGWVSGSDWRPDAPGPRRQDDYGYWGGEVHLPYRIGPHMVVVAGVHYAANFNRSLVNGGFGRSSDRNLWLSLGVNLDF